MKKSKSRNKNKTNKKKKSSLKKIVKNGKSGKFSNFKSKLKLSNYDEGFTDIELKKIENNYLIPVYKKQKRTRGILMHSGFATKNVAGKFYFVYDPLLINSIDLCYKVFYLFSPCLSSLLKNIYNKNIVIDEIIKKKFGRFLTYFDLEKDLGGDVVFQIKLFKYLLNENIVDNFKNLKNKKKILMYLNELVELRNHISHLSHKKEDYNIKKNNNHIVKRI